MSTNKHSQVTIPHLGKQFNGCIKSLEDLMKEAVQYGLAVEDQKKALAIWNDADGNQIEIYNEKSFQTYLKMPQTQLVIKQDIEDPIRITFNEIKRKNNIVYSFATTYHRLLEDLDDSFGLRFPNVELRIFWTDNEDDTFDITGERSFALFLKHGLKDLRVAAASLAISKGHSEPIKVIMTVKTLSCKEYVKSVTDWKELLREIEQSFKTNLTSHEYRVFWNDDENDELEISDDASFEMFLEQSENRKLFITKRAKAPSIKIYFMRLGEQNPRVFYWSFGKMRHLLTMPPTNFSIDLDEYKIVDADKNVIAKEEDFEAFLMKPEEKKNLFIEPKENNNFLLLLLTMAFIFFCFCPEVIFLLIITYMFMSYFSLNKA